MSSDAPTGDEIMTNMKRGCEKLVNYKYYLAIESRNPTFSRFTPNSISFSPNMFVLLFSIDPSLGRLDYESLSDQALMEMLIDGMEEECKKEFQDDSGHFMDVCDWKGIDLQHEEDPSIYIEKKRFSERQFPFQFIPALVTVFVLGDCNAHGTLNPSVLPSDLTIFEVPQNALHGSINFSTFPRNLEQIDISSNKFTGSCQLADLPDATILFDASQNEFSGKISLNELSDQIVQVFLSMNQLSGSLHITDLPASIEQISLSTNAFKGEFHFLTNPPSTLCNIWIDKNQLDSRAVFLGYQPFPMLFTLHHDTITRVDDEDGCVHPWEYVICRYNVSNELDNY